MLYYRWCRDGVGGCRHPPFPRSLAHLWFYSWVLLIAHYSITCACVCVRLQEGCASPWYGSPGDLIGRSLKVSFSHGTPHWSTEWESLKLKYGNAKQVQAACVMLADIFMAGFKSPSLSLSFFSLTQKGLYISPLSGSKDRQRRRCLWH